MAPLPISLDNSLTLNRQKPLSELMMALFTDAYLHHKACQSILVSDITLPAIFNNVIEKILNVTDFERDFYKFYQMLQLLLCLGLYLKKTSHR